MIAFVAFSFGFGVGKFTKLSNYFVSHPPASPSAHQAGWSTLEDEAFSIAYPKDWQAKKHTYGEPPGAKIESKGGKIEFWLKISRPYQISEEQKKQQTARKESAITIDGRTAKVSEFEYEYGGFFLVIELPAKDKKPLVTFWAIGANEVYRKTVSEIIATFQTKIPTR